MNKKCTTVPAHPGNDRSYNPAPYRHLGCNYFGAISLT
jgi:hypothetical protein